MGSSFTQLNVHLVWATRRREPWLVTELRPRVLGVIAARCVALNCLAFAVGGVEDHVHVLVSVHPSVAVADLARELKATSSGFVHYDCGVRAFAWQEGYGAFSVSQSDVDAVRRYVLDQVRHHADRSLVDAWERVSPPPRPAA